MDSRNALLCGDAMHCGSNRQLKTKTMLGEGMPWHILLPFLLLGILVGINSVREHDNKTNG